MILINNEDNTFSNFTTRLRITKEYSEKISSKFLHRFLKLQYLSGVTEKFQKNSTNIRNLQLKEYVELEIPLPPLPEQQRIVEKLDALFAGIEALETNTKQNLENAKELFQSYLQEVFDPSTHRDDDCGALSSSKWEEKKLGEVCEVIAGQSPQSKYYNNNGKGLPFYQGKKEFTDKFIGAPTKWTTKITKEAIKDDILMSVRAPVGPVNFSTQKICIGRGLAAIRASKRICIEFLFFFLLKHENEIIGNSGAVFNSINKTQIGAIKIPLPPLPEQQRIVEKLDALSTETKKLESICQEKLLSLSELKKSILDRAFKGKLL